MKCKRNETERHWSLRRDIKQDGKKRTLKTARKGEDVNERVK